MRRSPRAVALAVVSLVVALTVGLTGPSFAGDGDDEPSHAGTGAERDAPTLPIKCVAKKRYLIPQTALKCDLNPHIDGAPTIVLWGDSHVWQLIPALRTAIGTRKVNLVGFMMGSCPVTEHRFSSAKERRRTKGCTKLGHLAIRYLEGAKKAHRDVRVVLAMNWELYHNATTPPDATDDQYQGYITPYNTANGERSTTETPRAFRTLGRLHIPTDVVGPMPMVYQNAPPCQAGNKPYTCPLPRAGALVDEQKNLDRIARLRTKLTKPGRLIQPANYFCGSSTCQGIKNGYPTFFDTFHIGAAMSRQLAKPYFKTSVDALLAQHRR